MSDEFDFKFSNLTCNNVTTLTKQEKQCVAVGPGNRQFISIRHVASDAAMLCRWICGPLLLLPLLQHCCRYCRAVAGAAADSAAAALRQLTA